MTSITAARSAAAYAISLLGLGLGPGLLTACGQVVVEERTIERHGAEGGAGGNGNDHGNGASTGGQTVEPACGAEVCATPEDESCDGEGACTGKLLWARDGAGETGNRHAEDIAVDPWGDVLVTGSFAGDFDVAGVSLSSDEQTAFVLKLDTNGKGRWAVQAKGGGYGSAIGTDAAGNVLVAGSFTDMIDLGGGALKSEGYMNLFVAKFGPDGDLLWSRSHGGPGYQWPERLAVDSQSNIVIIGSIHDGFDFGDGFEPAIGETDVFVLKLDPKGERLWSRHWGTTKYDYGLAVATGPDDEVLLTGSSQGTMDFGGAPLANAGADDIFVVKLSASGQHVFSKRYGGAGFDLGKAITAHANGDVVVAGLCSGPTDFGGGPLQESGTFDACVARLAPDGEHLASAQLGGEGALAQVLDVAVDGAGNTVIYGTLSGAASFGGPEVVASGKPAEDVFLAKFDPQLHHVFSFAFGGDLQELPRRPRRGRRRQPADRRQLPGHDRLRLRPAHRAPRHLRPVRGEARSLSLHP